MKKMISVLFVMMLALAVSTADELKFETGEWSQIIKKAKAENKIIFLDAYTDWCGWCEVMDKKTFTDADVISFVNKNFIPVKYEMQTGTGKILAMKYRVRGFPSQLYFNSEGKLIYTDIGYKEPKKFIESLQKVLDSKNHKIYKGISDKLEPEFPDFYKLAFARNDSEEKKFPTPEEVVSYLDKCKSIFDEVAWSVYSVFQSSEKYDNFFIENYSKFVELYGESEVLNKFYDNTYQNVQKAIKNKDFSEMDKVLALIDKYDSKYAEENKDYYRMMYYERTESWDKFSDYAEDLISNNKANNDRINELCWNLYENCTDKYVLKKALKWISKATNESPNYANLDTHAALLYKTGNYKDAKIYAEKAIEIGKKSGNDVGETEKLLEKIKENQDK
ncbi:hypothetical protein MASR1M45_04900 [Candidatus Kapaibacterium sp.]